MNRKTITSFKYQFRDDRKSVIIYYIVLIAVYTLIMVTTGVMISGESNGEFQSNGFGLSTAIFMFCLCAFKENFYMLSQNGVSRKSIFIGRLINAFTLATIMAILDVIFVSIYSVIAKSMGESFIFESLYDMMYPGFNSDLNVILRLLTSIVFFIVLYFAFNMLGYLVGTLFHRLSKTFKVLFAAGLPTMIFVIYPIVDFTLFDGKISSALGNFFVSAFGLESQQPWFAVLTLLVITVICSICSWLFIRRARVE